jgi:tetratricopeptide (TPR) repeat protein
MALSPEELETLPEKDLIRRGTELWKHGQSREAAQVLFAACDRLSKKEETVVPAAALSLYAVCLAEDGRLKEAVDTCRHALTFEPYNPQVHLNMARVYLKGTSRKKAIEALNRGLALAPTHRGLQALRQEMGVREEPVVGFLPRDNPVNVALGKARSKIKKK